MAPLQTDRKRKAITRDAPEADEVALSDGGGDLKAGFLEGILPKVKMESRMGRTARALMKTRTTTRVKTV